MHDESHAHEPKKPLVDPKELRPAAFGLLIGIAIMTLFIAIGLGLGLTFLVDHGNLPKQ